MKDFRTSMKSRYPAQILLVTLLVLMIIAIIVVGVVGVASRDVLQTTTNKQYQKVYNAAESTIFKVIDKYGDASTPLGNLATEPFTTGSCTSVDSSTYACTFVDSDVTTELGVTDTSKVKDYELNKDASLELNLSGFKGNIVMNWTGSAAIEFALIYDVDGVTGMIGDLYDTSNVFTASGNVPTTRTVPESHAFLFSSDPSGGVTFNIATIVGLPSNAKTVSLRLTGRMGSGQGFTKLNLTADNGFPKQIREFTATSYDNASDVQSTATVVTQIPLLPQAPSPLNYALLTKDVVDKGLTPPPSLSQNATLSIKFAGLAAASGKVTGADGKVCTSDCTVTLPKGSIYNLVPSINAANGVFKGWSGACTGAGSINVTFDFDRVCTVTFTELCAGTPDSVAFDLGFAGKGNRSTSYSICYKNVTDRIYIYGSFDDNFWIGPVAYNGLAMLRTYGSCNGTSNDGGGGTYANGVSFTVDQFRQFGFDISGNYLRFTASVQPCDDGGGYGYLSRVPLSYTPNTCCKL